MARWRATLIVGLTVMLAWGIRGQHGHERGAAFVGASLGMALAAVTGAERWAWAAIWGSLGFALGGTISYGWLVSDTLGGSLPGLIGLLSVGACWGALGAGALGWGFRVSRPHERVILATLLGLAWICLDLPLAAMVSAAGVAQRALVLASFAVLVGLLLAYYVIRRRSPAIGRLAAAGAIGWAIGFPLGGCWLAIGPALGWPIDWWKWMEHTIGLCGGLAVAWGALRDPAWQPFPLSRWQRWMAFGWLYLVIPSWLWANNLRYWWMERKVMSSTGAGMLGALWILGIVAYVVLGAACVRAGIRFREPWSPARLRWLCLGVIWLGTVTAIAKTWVPQPWGSTQTVFIGMALVLTGLLVWPSRGRA